MTTTIATIIVCFIGLSLLSFGIFVKTDNKPSLIVGKIIPMTFGTYLLIYSYVMISKIGVIL